MKAGTVARAALTAAVIGATGVTAAACSSGPSAVTYALAAYYQSVHGIDECYYVDDASEVVNLVNAGLCPHGSIATPMPLTWEEEYWQYYSSTAYIDTYLPASRRTYFTNVTVVTFSRTYKTQITTLSSRAVYKGSNGTTSTGGGATKKFTGSGSGTGSVHGGGSARGCAVSMQELADKSSGGSSGSHGGGSARGGTGGGSSSGSKSGSKTGSGSNGGC